MNSTASVLFSLSSFRSNENFETKFRNEDFSLSLGATIALPISKHVSGVNRVYEGTGCGRKGRGKGWWSLNKARKHERSRVNFVFLCRLFHLSKPEVSPPKRPLLKQLIVVECSTDWLPLTPQRGNDQCLGSLTGQTGQCPRDSYPHPPPAQRGREKEIW